MFAFIEGEVAAKGAQRAVIQTGGIGYELLMSDHSVEALPDSGEKVHVFTYLSVTENGVALYGFMDAAEEALFKQLIAVSGIGPKMALAALSTYTAPSLIAAIVTEDVKAVSKIPGIGKKTASRIVLELKDSFPKTSTGQVEEAAAPSSSALSNVVDALLSMGFSRAEVDAAVADAPADGDEETLLQYALKRIA